MAISSPSLHRLSLFSSTYLLRFGGTAWIKFGEFATAFSSARLEHVGTVGMIGMKATRLSRLLKSDSIKQLSLGRRLLKAGLQGRTCRVACRAACRVERCFYDPRNAEGCALPRTATPGSPFGLRRSA